MLKISIFDSPSQRRLVLEGKLIAPWAAEFETVCEKAKVDLDGRELVIEVKNLIAINQVGENILLELMKEGVKVRCSGVFTKHIVKQLARRTRQNLQETKK